MDATERKGRTSSSYDTLMNLFNLNIGIAMISFPKSVSWVGFVGSGLGIMFTACLSIISSYFLIKARNRLKHESIKDMPDLGAACYGKYMRWFCNLTLTLANVSFLMAYVIYLGK